MTAETARQLTDEELRQAGYDALLRELGVSGFVRFIRLVSPGVGDYTEERQEWLGNETVEQITERIRQRRTTEAD
jgi:hypothetical protein